MNEINNRKKLNLFNCNKKGVKIKSKMDSNSVSPLPPPEAPLAMMEVNEKTPPRSPSGHDMPPPPDEK